MKKAAVIPSDGIGDGLLMMIFAHHLDLLGYQVTVFHPHLEELKDWFPKYLFAKKNEKLIEELQTYDFIILQNDNRSFSIRLKEMRQFYKKCSVIYSSYKEEKHGLLDESFDVVFDPKVPMASNIFRACKKLFSECEEITKNNGIVIPDALIHRRYTHRIIIHPSSADPKKNWCKKKFFTLATHLEQLGYQVIFAVSKDERDKWLSIQDYGFDLPYFTSLSDFASYLYESGGLIGNDSLGGHLASLLCLPTLIIAKDEKHMQLWRPDWNKSTIITPSSWIPNIKFLRLREINWKHFISPKRVLKEFEKSTHF